MSSTFRETLTLNIDEDEVHQFDQVDDHHSEDDAEADHSEV